MRSLAVLCLVAACANANHEAGGIAIAPATLSVAAGQTGALTATGDDLAGIVWTTDAPDVATVTGDASATVTGVKPGHATITALVGAVASSVDVTVTAAVVDRIDVTATPAIVPLGTTAQLAAQAHYSDGHTVDATAMVAWSLADAQLGAIDASGLLTTAATGTTDATAMLDDVTGTASVMVARAALVSLAIADANPGEIPKGVDHPLVANGTFTDGTVADITAMVTWSSSKPAVATVAAGIVHAVDVGTSTITAAEDAISATASVGVSAAVLQSLALDQPDSSVALGRALAVHAMGTYSDGSTQDVTSVAQWTSSTGAASVTLGAVQSLAVGTTRITAALDQQSAALGFTVTPAVIDHLAIAPGDVTLMQHQKAQLHASLVYSDNTRVDATSGAWMSSSGAVTASAGLLASGATAGSATITATASGFTATITATVTGVACHVVINELVSAGSSSSDEWAELYNPCTSSFDVTGWTLDYRAATNATGPDNLLLATLAGTMAPGDFRLYAGAGYPGAPAADGTWGGGASGELQANNGGVGLRSGAKDTGAIVDAIAYGTVIAAYPFQESAAAPMLGNAFSLRRVFDGDDTNNNAADFVVSTTPTPRAPN